MAQLHDAPHPENVSNEKMWNAMQLRRLLIFMPAFRARALGGEVTSSMISMTHKNLVNYTTSLNNTLHTKPMNDNYKKLLSAHMAECEIQALLTRKNIMPYPALSREEASHNRSKLNHDFYTLDGTRKHMFQVKTSSKGNGYDSRVAVIQHHSVLLEMRRQPEKHRNVWEPSRDHEEFEWPTPYVHEQILVGKKPNPLGQLLADEMAGGHRFDREKRIALDLASAHVITRKR